MQGLGTSQVCLSVFCVEALALIAGFESEEEQSLSRLVYQVLEMVKSGGGLTVFAQ